MDLGNIILELLELESNLKEERSKTKTFGGEWNRIEVQRSKIDKAVELLKVVNRIEIKKHLSNGTSNSVTGQHST